jgi:hypothetical protein
MPKAAIVARVWGSWAKKSESVGFAPGQPPSMTSTPEGVEHLRDAELLGRGELDALGLGAVAERGVVKARRSVGTAGVPCDLPTRFAGKG